MHFLYFPPASDTPEVQISVLPSPNSTAVTVFYLVSISFVPCFPDAAHLWQLVLAVVMFLFQAFSCVLSFKLRLLTFPRTRRLIRWTVVSLHPKP